MRHRTAAHGYRFRRPLSFKGDMVKFQCSLVYHWGTLGSELQLGAFPFSGLLAVFRDVLIDCGWRYQCPRTALETTQLPLSDQLVNHPSRDTQRIGGHRTAQPFSLNHWSFHKVLHNTLFSVSMPSIVRIGVAKPYSSHA
jgi:hypothetical protein